MSKQVWLAALTAAFIAGGMAVAHAQAAGGGGGGAGGGGGGGGASAGGGSGGGGGQGGTDPSNFRSNSRPSPIYKDERFERYPGRYPEYYPGYYR